jgi:flagellar P-ring protein precursor FlgI
MRHFLFSLIALGFATTALAGGGTAAMEPLPGTPSRLKDLIMIEGARDNQLVGYGLVTGLAGTGDGKVTQTVQSIANALQRFGINVPSDAIKSGNVAAVMITADIAPSLRSGSRIDVTVSSMGDAKSLQGGILMQTPLLGADGRPRWRYRAKEPSNCRRDDQRSDRRTRDPRANHQGQQPQPGLAQS